MGEVCEQGVKKKRGKKNLEMTIWGAASNKGKGGWCGRK